MKNVLYTLGLFLLITSCRSIEKMVDRGEYDEAIIFATEKLAGKKNKKTKHVKGLEEAFAKITKRDMNKIDYLNGNARPDNWDEIYSIATVIERRQSRIEPHLPLISKNGYEAQFNFVKTNIIKEKANKGAADFHYNEGLRSLELLSTSGNKRYARNAYKSFIKADKRIANYKESNSLIEQSIEAGKVRILVDMINNSNTVVPQRFEEKVRSITVRELNSLWKTFHLNRNNETTYDYTATLLLTDIDVSPEREFIREVNDSKEIKDGWEYLKNDDGSFVIDTTGEKIKVDKIRIITAYVTELQREKAARVVGVLKYKDNINGELLQSRPIEVEAIFTDYASQFRGDRRALCDQNRNRLKRHPLPFPDDLMMIMDASENLKSIFKSELRRLAI